MAKDKQNMDFEAFRAEVLSDYKLVFESRQASLLGRKEVLTGKAKFGIFGDGKEVAQIAMAKAFKKGDTRSRYYRDQTFMFATGINTIQQFFAHLYAHTDIEAEPNSAGRSMNGHFGSRQLDKNGNWLPQTDRFNSSSDISPTAGQMPRLLGLALASKLYRQNPDLHTFTDFSNQGNEVAFGTIGNASTSEGGFWEVINAAGVLQVPMAMSVWDDGYGISVPAKYQTTKENISTLLKGFNSGSCYSSDTLNVIVMDDCGEMYIPNAFSPNNDGHNDVLYLKGHCLQIFTFMIFNRWGEKVFETTDQKIGWDGLYKGSELNTGIYVYRVEGRNYDGKGYSANGNITLIR